MTNESAGEPTRIVVVGSGFAGFECARALVRRLRGTDARITMISPHDYMLYTPLLPEVAGGILDARFVTVPLSEALPNVELVKGSVDSVDFESRTVHVTDCEQGVEDVAWDRVVITPGSVTRLFDIPGLAEHARGLETPAEALYFRDQLLTQIELAERDTDPSVADARRTVVVVGASYAGTELTAQLRALADEAAARRNLDPAKIRFLLLDAADKVMPEVGEKLGGKVLDVLRSRGIDVRLETTLTELGPEHVTLDDGTVVPTRTVAWVTGVTASPLIDTLGLPTEKGRLTVRPDLSVDGHPDVFAGGDAAAVPDPKNNGSVTPPTAQHAVRQGQALARNVAASLGVGDPKPYSHRDMGLVVDLGPGFAVANPLGIQLSGFLAKVVTRAYHLYAMPNAANRWAVALAYLTDLLFPRPLVSIGLVTDSESRFAAGEGVGAQS
ncbi:NAD(P)/FAD-dependent oxidoreductase [Rhodococcus opacus]|uniref:NAD(P)/FAD-dependent oxidoreductase n=1 Tax=Rhodococcus opacus TaxID=37919 RepID=UPI002948D241|nr:NAD(P)/FAD-dependent oxidoreductase [Rhodococcus opacus]MDV6241575.1 NAD(P)/FAD-dependent oxidoreductase [Rhodococcus opacus]